MRFLRSLLLLLVISAAPLALTSCGPKATQVNVPGSLNNADALIYQEMQTVQAAIEQAKLGIAKYPQLKEILNKIIASYNVAEASYQTYHKVGSGDTAALQTQVTTLLTDIAFLQAKMGLTKQ